MFSFLYNDKSNVLGDKRIQIVHPKSEDFPKSARGYAANNVYDGFPPIMSDGRALIGAWQPESYENDALVRDAGITNNWDYRQYLMKNAESIVRRNFIESANDVGFYERGLHEPQRGEFTPMVLPSHTTEYASPQFYSSVQQPQASYGYVASDLKDHYLSREQMALERASHGVALTQEELIRVLESRRRGNMA